MCKVEYEFFHECGHLTKHVFNCAVRQCVFEDRDRLQYTDDGICYVCLRNRRNVRPSPSQLIARRWHMFRRMICLRRIAEEHRVARERMIEWIEREVAAAADNDEPEQARPFNNGQVFDTTGDELFKPADTSATPPEEETSCDICGECFGKPDRDGVTEHAVRLPCHETHVFGNVCIRRWFSENDSCPTCRQKFNVIRPIPSHLDDINRYLRMRAAALGFGVGLFMFLPRQVSYTTGMDEPNNVHEVRHHDVQFVYNVNIDPEAPIQVYLAEDIW